MGEPGEWTEVRSSVIHRVRYDRDTNVLDVEFQTGRIYRYFMVPMAVNEELMAARSIGAHFNERIRDRYPNEELHTPPDPP